MNSVPKESLTKYPLSEVSEEVEFPLAASFNHHPSDSSSIIRPQHSAVELLLEIPWTFKYIKYGELMFNEFVEYTQDLML